MNRLGRLAALGALVLLVCFVGRSCTLGPSALRVETVDSRGDVPTITQPRPTILTEPPLSVATATPTIQSSIPTATPLPALVPSKVPITLPTFSMPGAFYFLRSGQLWYWPSGSDSPKALTSFEENMVIVDYRIARSGGEIAYLTMATWDLLIESVPTVQDLNRGSFYCATIVHWSILPPYLYHPAVSFGRKVAGVQSFGPPMGQPSCF